MTATTKAETKQQAVLSTIDVQPQSMLKKVLFRAAFTSIMCDFSHAIVDGEFACMDAAYGPSTLETVRQWHARKLAKLADALFTHCFIHVDNQTGKVTFGDVPGVMAVPVSEHYVLDSELHNEGVKLKYPMVKTWDDFAFDVSMPLEYVPVRRMSAQHPELEKSRQATS